MDTDSQPEASVVPPRRIRWWPAALILFIVFAVVVHARWIADIPYQSRNLRSAIALLNAPIFLLIWWLFLSRAAWRLKWRVTLIFLAALGVVAGLVRIEGVSGDLLPELGWRWKTREPRSVPPLASSPPKVVSLVETESGLDYPQFLGPLRNGELKGLQLVADWVKDPPAELWRQPVEPAWSGFAVSGKVAVTQEQEGENESVVARELTTGQILWRHSDVARYDNTIAGIGPRATPTIVSNRVVTMGATGLLTCLDLEKGGVIWQRDLRKEHQAPLPDWGFTSAPLVHEGMVIVSAGGKPEKSLVAHRWSDGSLVWGAGKGSVGFSAPVHLVLAGVSNVVIFNDTAIFGHDPMTGSILWSHPWPGGHPHVAVPAWVAPDRLLISSGYGTGSQLIRLKAPVQAGEAWGVERLWKTARFRNKFSNPVVRGGYAYGFDDGVLACQELETGELKWKGERYGHGQVLLVGDHLLVTAESGEVMLFEVTPEAPRLLTQFKAVTGKTWNPPALAGEFLLIRNAEEAACFRVKRVKISSSAPAH